ncbi:MAG: beta-ketoacyl synthase N-terminal-like domain-containing protein, partial [Planktomarina sp.]
MRRVVITGLGVISPIGNNFDEVTEALQAGRSGIASETEYAENGFRSRVAGIPKINPAEHIDKRHMRFMGPGMGYNFLAMEQAIADSGLEKSEVSNVRTGLIMGSGGPSTSNFLTAFDVVKNKGGPKRMGPFMVTRCMSSCHSATLATPFEIKGVNYSITSACATSAH